MAVFQIGVDKKIEPMKHFFEYQMAGIPEMAFEHSDQDVRLEAYRALGFPESTKTDRFLDIQLAAWRALGWTEEAKKSWSGFIRREAYIALGWTEEAFDDDEDLTVIMAYNALGWREEAKKSGWWAVRLWAYRKLGWDRAALEDDHQTIRREARRYFICRDFIDNTPPEELMRYINDKDYFKRNYARTKLGQG